jgi:hypothetical protein
LDSLGKGIEGKFNIGSRMAAYPIKNVIAWLEERSNQSQEKKDNE